MRRPSTRTVVVVGVLVALVLAGVVSFYASSEPDGLDRVSRDEGFAATEKEHGSSGSPLSDYAVDGVDDERVSGGLAGVLGVGVVLVLTAGIAYAVRRRPDSPPEAEAEAGAGAGAGSPDAVETGAR